MRAEISPHSCIWTEARSKSITIHFSSLKVNYYARFRGGKTTANTFIGPKFHVHHSSFEVHDFDIQALGHQWLQRKNYDLVWGVGRHVLGSQIFDYLYEQSPTPSNM